MPKNLCSKTRKIFEPYEIWCSPKNSFDNWTWFILKKWKNPEAEKNDRYARWFCAVMSPYVITPEYGDVYRTEVTSYAYRLIGSLDGAPTGNEYHCFDCSSKDTFIPLYEIQDKVPINNCCKCGKKLTESKIPRWVVEYFLEKHNG